MRRVAAWLSPAPVSGRRQEGRHPVARKAARPAVLADDRGLDARLDKQIGVAPQFLRHVDAGTRNAFGVGVDGQDVIDAGAVSYTHLEKPHCVTMARASLVACAMSEEAPDVMFSLPNLNSSATRPPIMIASLEIMYL